MYSREVLNCNFFYFNDAYILVRDGITILGLKLCTIQQQ